MKDKHFQPTTLNFYKINFFLIGKENISNSQRAINPSTWNYTQNTQARLTWKNRSSDKEHSKNRQASPTWSIYQKRDDLKKLVFPIENHKLSPSKTLQFLSYQMCWCRHRGGIFHPFLLCFPTTFPGQKGGICPKYEKPKIWQANRILGSIGQR